MDGEDFFELLGIIYTKFGCVSLSKLMFTGLKKHGGSGRVRVLGPDPTRPVRVWTRPDPPFLSIFRTRPDPTRPDPTRGSTRPGNNSGYNVFCFCEVSEQTSQEHFSVKCDKPCCKKKERSEHLVGTTRLSGNQRFQR